MSLAITFLILAPFAALTLVGIALDERYDLTERATNRIRRHVTTQHQDA